MSVTYVILSLINPNTILTGMANNGASELRYPVVAKLNP